VGSAGAGGSGWNSLLDVEFFFMFLFCLNIDKQ